MDLPESTIQDVLQHLFKDELTCPVCLDDFTGVVYAFPCATQIHYLCCVCWETMKKKKRGILRCPTCRHDISMYRNKTPPTCSLLTKILENKSVTAFCGDSMQQKNIQEHNKQCLVCLQKMLQERNEEFHKLQKQTKLVHVVDPFHFDD